jgi:hypothetical protein
MEHSVKKATVTLLVDSGGAICLARKKQAIHHEGGTLEYSLGMYNGYGGKMEEFDSTIFHTAIRELHDEAVVSADVSDLKLVLRVYFFVMKDGDSVPFMDVSFFFLYKWQGDPSESSEMGEPHFFQKNEIPYNEMMPADKILFETMFQGNGGVYEVHIFGSNSTPRVVRLDEEL